MQAKRSLIDELNNEVGQEMHIPYDICGDFTITRYFNEEPSTYIPTDAHPITRCRRIVHKDTDSSVVAAPGHSLASNNDDAINTVTEEQQSSDYVSTLRDPNEEQ